MQQNRLKAHKYWPSEKEECVQFDRNISVTLTKTETRSGKIQ